MKPVFLTAAALFATATAAGAQSTTSYGPYKPYVPQQNPAPIVRRSPSGTRPAHPLEQSFAVTYGANGAAQVVQPAPKPKPARPAQIAPANAPASSAPVSTPHPISLSANQTAPAAPVDNTPVQLPSLPFNRTTIVLDPGHGGPDSGARISDNLLEKDITLALAFKLRSLLEARGFTVVMTRDSDSAVDPNNPAEPLTLDLRAGIANHERAVACLLLHATGAGAGVHLYHSELTPAAAEPASPAWLSAQAPWVPDSEALAQSLGQALTRAQIPLVSSAASVRPLDSLTCPALVVELAPQNNDVSSIANDDYQQNVAQAIASALVFWKNQVQPPPRLQTASAKSSGKAKPAHEAVKPAPAANPDEATQ